MKDLYYKTTRCDKCKDGYEDYYDEYFITFYTSEKGKKVATVKFVAFDEEKIEDDGVNFPLLADDLGTDYLAVATCMNTPLFDLEKNEDDFWGPGMHVVYIERLFVEPNFRNQGVAEYILSSLTNILKSSLDIYPHLYTLAVRPDDLPPKIFTHPNGIPVSELENYKKMKKLMTNVIKKAGFVKSDNYDQDKIWIYNASLNGDLYQK